MRSSRKSNNPEIESEPLVTEGHPVEDTTGSFQPHFNVALVEPEIPQNTGNIGRTCVATQCHLEIVGKTGFRITDKNLKRAGLDYWPHLSWKHHENFEEWHAGLARPSRVFYLSTKGSKFYTDEKFQLGDTFVFGKETKGLPEELLAKYPDQVIKIPLLGPTRSLNVATAVAIVLYEAIRQTRV